MKGLKGTRSGKIQATGTCRPRTPEGARKGKDEIRDLELQSLKRIKSPPPGGWGAGGFIKGNGSPAERSRIEILIKEVNNCCLIK